MQLGGCQFSRFFQTTPQDLIDDGLYKAIAIAIHPGAHRAVSLSLVAMACGALPKNTKHMPKRSAKEEKMKRAQKNRTKYGKRHRQKRELPPGHRNCSLRL